MKRYDRNTEMRVLGALIIHGSKDEATAANILSMVTEDYFFPQETKSLFKLISSQASKGLPFDAVTLSPIAPDGSYELLQPILGGEYYSFNTITNDIAVLKLMRGLRPKMDLIANINRDLVTETDPNQAHMLMYELGAKLTQEAPDNSDYQRSFEQIVDSIMMSDDKPTTLKTNMQNWPELPAVGMITVAGRSGVGKTFMGIHLMEKILEAKPGTHAIYFNLEMSERAMMDRYLNMVYRRTGSLKESLHAGGASEILKRAGMIITKPGISMSEIEMISKCQSLKNQVSVIVIDYVGQVKSPGGERYQQLEQIAQDLAGLAIKLDCIVIALQQVNRASQTRAKDDRVPYPVDGAGSVGFERASEWWIGIDQPQIDEPDNPSLKDLFVIKNRKQRGPGGYFTVYQEFRDGRFHDINQQEARNRLQVLTESVFDKFRKDR